LFSDEEGGSHFEDLEVALEAQDFSPPAAPLHVAPHLRAGQSMWVGAQPGWGGETPHPSPQRQVFCVMQGSFEVTASGGDTRVFAPGTVLQLEDTSGEGHSTRIVGDEDVLIFATVLA
ncbi:MAG: hypothetical protein O2816_17220, partial [Planctomycetota bacterium]|nr:hypothetical protein [Planctomycetota bacterium]